MQINERRVFDIVILDILGKITLGEGDELLKTRVDNLLSGGNKPKKVIMNLEGIPYIDGAGLGEFVRSYTNINQAGGKMKLLKASKRVMNLLEVTKLIHIFEHFDTEEKAIQSFWNH